MPVSCVVTLFNLPHIVEVFFISTFSGRLLSLFWQSLLTMLTWQGLLYYMYRIFVWPHSSTGDFIALGTTPFSISGTTTNFRYSGTFGFDPSLSFGQTTIPFGTTAPAIGRFSHYISTEFWHYILLQIKFRIGMPPFTGTKKQPAIYIFFVHVILMLPTSELNQLINIFLFSDHRLR
jgi:hypothetical protein